MNEETERAGRFRKELTLKNFPDILPRHSRGPPHLHLRVPRIGSVLQAMHLCPLLFSSAAAVSSMMLSPAPAGAQELPSGSSAAFREKMTEWSAPEPSVPVEPSTLPSTSVAAAIGQSRPGALPRLSSGFGQRRHPILGKRAMHSGIDIPGPLGTPIHASEGGVVRFSGKAGGYGSMIEIDHGNGMRTRYAHLSRLLVAPGTPVARGEAIALMGSTGRSTGSHLHFEVRVNGRAADPLAYLGGPGSYLPAASARARRYAVSTPHISRYARSREAMKRQEE